MKNSNLLFKFSESEIVPFAFWRVVVDDIYHYVKAYDVKKTGFMPKGISTHFTK